MREWHRWIAFLICAFTIGSYPLFQARNQADQQFGGATRSEWGAANVWLASVQCYLQTGVWLAICVDGRIEPIADHSLADDPGHTFLLTLKAKLQGKPQFPADIARLNLRINHIALILLCLSILHVGTGIQSLLLFLFAAPVYAGMVSASPHPAIIGAATLAGLPALILLMRAHNLIARWRFALYLAIGIGSFAAASLLREPVGTMGFLVTALALIYVMIRKSRVMRWWIMLAVAASVLVAWKSSYLLLSYRDYVFAMPTSQQTPTHGISHNLFIGLGAIENKWGVRWDDTYAADAVAKIDPKIAYVSHDYFKVLWRLYLEKLMDDPVEVVRIYFVKAGKVLEQELPSAFFPLWICLLLGAANIFLICRRGVMDDATRLHLIVASVSLVFIGLFVLQGALAHYAPQYSEPIAAFVLLPLATWMARVFTCYQVAASIRLT